MGSKYVLLVGNDSDAREHGLSFTEAGTGLMKLIEHLAGLIREPIWPAFPRGKAAALYYVGAPRFHQGVLRRAAMPSQTEAFALLEPILRQGQGTLYGTPQLGLQAATQGLPDTFKERQKRVPCKDDTEKSRASVAVSYVSQGPSET